MKVAALALCVAAGSAVLAARQAAEPEVVAAVRRVGEYVEQYYARAQSIVAEESVTLQPLRADLSPDGFARRLTYELRVDWKPDAPPDQRAVVVRELLKAAGPPLGPPDQPDCMDPRSVSPEPLAFLLPGRRQKFTYRVAGEARVDGRAAMMIDYKPEAAEPPRVDWDGDCAQIELPGRTAGRIWADAATSAILRYDEHLVGWTDIPGPRDRKHVNSPLWYTVERADTSIRYRTVAFQEPDETLLLPSEIISLTVIRNSGLPRLRTTQTFANYRRYVTEGRLVE
jgi:hypothetical protein